MEGTLADVGLSRERGTRRHTPQGGPPTPPGLPVSPKWSVPAPPTSPLLWPSLSRTRYCLRELKKQVGSQGGAGWGKRSPGAKPWRARPRPPAPTPGAGWLPAGHAHGAAGRRAPGGRGARVQFLAAGSRRGPERAGTEGSRPAGSWSRTREREARPQRRRRRSEVCEDAEAHPRAWSAASRGCERREATALLYPESSGGSDLSKERARRWRVPRDPRARGAGGGGAGARGADRAGRGTVMSQRAGRLHAAAATWSICRPSCRSRSGPRPWRR